jgi:hypothetical protein
MLPPRTTLALLSLAAAAALLAGCGGSGRAEGAPAACREGTAAILDALRGAPGEVVLGGEAPLSECLVPGAEEGELADLGEGALAAANRLNSEARAGGGGAGGARAALEVGYLVGAIARGETHTEGVHNELLRRLTVSAKFAPHGESLPPGFLAAYAKGFRAGRSHG